MRLVVALGTLVIAVGSLAAQSRVRAREQDIEFFRARIERDPTGALDLLSLGNLLLERYGQSGDDRDLMEAEAVARTSLAHRHERNSAALRLLTSALLGQHRFLEARTVSEELVKSDPDPLHQAIHGEVLLELGEYEDARRIFRGLAAQRWNAGVAPRYARWLELTGRVGEARRLLESEARELERNHNSQLEQLAWFELRLGELALRFGAYGESARRLDLGLSIASDNWKLLAARARLALATGDLPRAIALGDSSLSLHLDPATLAEVGDAWRARGDPQRADDYYRAMEAATQAPRGGFHRAWYLALLDHGRQIPAVLASVSRDIESRKDVYGYDLLAWALFKNGRAAEARAAMRQALGLGTEDPMLHAHARAIGGLR